MIVTNRLLTATRFGPVVGSSSGGQQLCLRASCAVEGGGDCRSGCSVVIFGALLVVETGIFGGVGITESPGRSN